MKNVLLLVLVLACTVAMAATTMPADEINVSGLPYKGVKITGFDGKDVSFQYNSRMITKPISQVRFISMTDEKTFSEAENLVAADRIPAAIRTYQTAARRASDPWLKALIEYRLGLIEAKAPANGGAGNGGQATANTCEACGGTGKMACPDCSVNGKSTGKMRCPKCEGKGRTPCPQCHGAWRLDACGGCKGKGKMAKFDWKWNAAARKITRIKTAVTCVMCGGKGFSKVCQTCGGNKVELRGTITCLLCQGRGVVEGVCTTCKGQKKVHCTFCNGTGDPSKGTAVAVKPPDNGTGGNGVKPPVKPKDPVKHVPVAGPLGTPDTLVAALRAEPKHPSENKAAWARMSIPQQDAAEEAHAMAMVRWLSGNEFHGKSVSWAVAFVDVEGAGDEYLVKAQSSAGTLVTAAVAATARKVIKKLSKGDAILIKGVIRKYAPTETGGAYRIDLSDANVSPS